MQTISSEIQRLREQVVFGRLIDLVPFTPKYSQDVVNLRNQDKNKYFLNQTYELTVESQNAWYESYLERNDDIYWCLVRKDGTFVGTYRLYDVSEDRSQCEQGSFMVDETYAEEGPYALEAELLSLDVAFDVLGVKTVVNQNRSDNKVMNNLSKKLGFEYVRDVEIRGVSYRYLELTKEDYIKKRPKVDGLLEYWKNR